MIEYLIISIIIILYIKGIVLGFILAKVYSKPVYTTLENKPNSFFKDKKKNSPAESGALEKIKSVQIDDTKIVIGIDTSSIEKKFDNIASTTEIQDNITESANKLSQMIKRR